MRAPVESQPHAVAINANVIQASIENTVAVPTLRNRSVSAIANSTNSRAPTTAWNDILPAMLIGTIRGPDTRRRLRARWRAAPRELGAPAPPAATPGPLSHAVHGPRRSELGAQSGQTPVGRRSDAPE